MDDSPSTPPGSGSARSRRPSSLRRVLGGAMVLAGLVWIGQGLGIFTAGGSFMIGDPLWAVIGVVFVVLGVVVAWKAPRT